MPLKNSGQRTPTVRIRVGLSLSRFTTCGSWEGHNILDFIVENESDVQPDTIHADTQGQSAAIFGLAHLLGIQLQPRIRNWKDLHLFRSDPGVRYEHIDLLFTERVDWDLIETMLPEMLRVSEPLHDVRVLRMPPRSDGTKRAAAAAV